MMNSRYPPIAPLNPAAMFPIGEGLIQDCFSGNFPTSATNFTNFQPSSDFQLGSSPPMDLDIRYNNVRRNSEMLFPQYAPDLTNRRNSEMGLPSTYAMEAPITAEMPIISHRPTPRALKAKRCPTNKCPCGGKEDCIEPGCIKSAGHYVCPVCSIEFSRKNSMRRHVLTHINLRPYECQACQKSFYRSDIYKRHLSSKKCRRNLHLPSQLQPHQQPDYQVLSPYLNHHIPQL